MQYLTTVGIEPNILFEPPLDTENILSLIAEVIGSGENVFRRRARDHVCEGFVASRQLETASSSCESG